MSRKLAVALAALVAATAAGGAAAADTPAAISPDDASALVSTGFTSSVSATAAVDPATALAAGSIPGADTAFDSDMTPEQAVGLTPVTTTALRSTAAVAAGAPIVCWTNAAWGRWGTWPYEQKITDTSYWCAQYGVKITYRSTSVTAEGTLCGVSWREKQLIAGGVKFPSFTMRSSAGFSCQTDIPWISLHPSHHIDVFRDDRGVAKLVG